MPVIYTFFTNPYFAAIYSARIPISLMTLPHLAISDLIVSAADLRRPARRLAAAGEQLVAHVRGI